MGLNALVSVIMPVFNGEKYLKEAIDSILNQTYSFIELIIINDGSSDGSEEIIKTYSDSRIVYLKNVQNIGLIETLNIGLRHAKGKYFARMDADDISLPTRLEKQINFFEQHPKIGIVGTSYSVFGDKHEMVRYPSMHEDIKLACLFYNPFCHPSIMIRKEIIDKYDLFFRKEYIHAEEYKLWTEILTLTEGHNLEEELLLYRVHVNQISQVYLNQQIENSKIIQKEFLENAGFDIQEKDLGGIWIDKCDVDSNLMDCLTGLQKLMNQNEKLNFFTVSKLNRILSARYKNLLLELDVMTSEVYEHYRNSLISGSIDWSFRQKISLFAKYILRKRLKS